jgi:hypothetical protein
MGTNRNLFDKPVSKMRESQQLFSGLRLLNRMFEKIHPSNPNQNSAALWRIFSSNKSAPANRKKGFYTSHLPKNDDISGTIAFSDSEL